MIAGTIIPRGRPKPPRPVELRAVLPRQRSAGGGGVRAANTARAIRPLLRPADCHPSARKARPSRRPDSCKRAR